MPLPVFALLALAAGGKQVIDSKARNDAAGKKAQSLQDRLDFDQTIDFASQDLPGLRATARERRTRFGESPILDQTIAGLQAQGVADVSNQRRVEAAGLASQGGIDAAALGNQQSIAAATLADQRAETRAVNAFDRANPAQVPGAIESGPIPSGVERVTAADGTTRLRPVPGGAAYQKAVQPVLEADAKISRVNKFMSLIEQTGGESFGAGAAEQNLLYNEMLSTMGFLNNAGVLQAGEIERFKAAMINPTDLRSRTRLNSTLLAAPKMLNSALTRMRDDAVRSSGIEDVGALNLATPFMTQRELEESLPLPPGARVIN